MATFPTCCGSTPTTSSCSPRWTRRGSPTCAGGPRGQTSSSCDGQTAGFVLVFGPGTDYDSANYRWFSERYGTQFHYLDRIVIDDRFRRRGLASAVYDAVEETAQPRERLVLEVNIDPPNEPSLEFHRRRGYREVTQLGEPGHRVSLMARDISDERTSENVT